MHNHGNKVCHYIGLGEYSCGHRDLRLNQQPNERTRTLEELVQEKNKKA